jgi:hypothetical protein
MNELRDIHGFCDSVKLGWVRLEMADSAGVADFPVSQAGFFGIPGGEGVEQLPGSEINRDQGTGKSKRVRARSRNLTISFEQTAWNFNRNSARAEGEPRLGEGSFEC